MARTAPFVLCLLFIGISTIVAQEQPTCSGNEVFNGRQCVCSAGYFSEVQEKRCDDECGEVFFSLFTYGTCVNIPSSTEPGAGASNCDRRCGLRIRLWTTIFIFAVFAAAVATLFFTLPMCIATCCSCVQAKKANRNTKKVNQTVFTDGIGGTHVGTMELAKTQQQQQQQAAAASQYYSPYAYWPYYGRM